MSRPVVIKFGSSTLVDARGRLRKSRLDRVADELGALSADVPICIVSSGAIALGLPNDPDRGKSQSGDRSEERSNWSQNCAVAGVH